MTDLAMGVLLHLWIMGCMTMPVFGILMIATCLCYISEEELERVIGCIRGLLTKARARASMEPAGK